MAKIGFCAVSGSGMSALAQVLKYKNNDVYGSDRSFDQGKDQKNKQALTDIGIKIYPQDGSMLDKDFSVLYASTAVEDTIPDIKRAKELNIPIKKRSDLLAEIFASYKYNIAVGGTSGKSTTTAMIGYILDKALKKPLVINGALLKNYANQKGIPNVILNNGEFCVIEADESDGSIEKYTPYISVVNNITLDHKSIEELQALFGDFIKKGSHGAVLNKDCPNTTPLLNLNANTVTFSIKDRSANFYAEKITPVFDGTLYTFCGQEYKLPLIGAFNVANALCAIAICDMLNVDPASICEGLKAARIKGRVEPIHISDDYTLLIDYAHNAMALESLLTTLRAYEPKRLVCLFGCGGNRSRARRFEMGEVSGRLSDLTIITSDNPRFEEPLDIIADIKTGIDKTNGRYIEIADRKEAISYSIDHAMPGDIIVLAGKGHEDYQEIKGVKYPMDERILIDEILKEREA